MTINPLSMQALQEISSELNKNKPDFDHIGLIMDERKRGYLSNPFADRDQPRLVELIQKLNRTLGSLEEKGIKFFNSANATPSFIEEANRYRAERKIYLTSAERIGTQVTHLKKCSNELKKAYQELQCREVGLRYSLGESNLGIDPLPEPDKECVQALIRLADKWKKKQKFGSKELDSLQHKQIEELARYPEWVKIATNNPRYLAEAFGWSLHKLQSVEVLVKNYEMRRKIKVAYLDSNLGYATNIYLNSEEERALAYKNLPTKVDGVFKRVLTLAIYHGEFDKFDPAQQERINILKPGNVVHFKKGNYCLTVEELFKELGKKNEKEVNLSLCGDWGLVNFHPVKGVWNADLSEHQMPDLGKIQWVDQVPPTRIVSHKELLLQYGDKVKDRNFFFKVMATRQQPGVIALDSHAYLQLFVKMGDDNWKVVSIGLFAHRFQQGIIDGLGLFAASVERVVCLVDQNSYYTHRQRGGVPIFCSDEAKELLLERLQEMIGNRGVFQFAGRNCAYGVQKIVEELAEKQLIEEKSNNFFKMPMEQSRAGIGPLDKLFSWVEKQWEWVRWFVMTWIHTLLGSHRTMEIGDEKYSLREFIEKNGRVTYNPSHLLRQIEEDQSKGEGPFLNGELYWSVTDEKRFQGQALIQKRGMVQI